MKQREGGFETEPPYLFHSAILLTPTYTSEI